MSTSAIGTVMDAIRAALVVRAGLQGVRVFSGPIGLEEAGLECIAFGDARLTEVLETMGGNKTETWDVEGEVYMLVKHWQGDLELTIKAARDRTLAIFAQIESHVNDTYTGSVPDGVITSGEIVQGYNTEGRTCRLPFTLTIKASKNP